MKFYGLNAARSCRCRIKRKKERCNISAKFLRVHHLLSLSPFSKSSWKRAKTILVRIISRPGEILVPDQTRPGLHLCWSRAILHGVVLKGRIMSQRNLPFETFGDYHYVQLLLRCVWVLWLLNFSNLPRVRPQSFAFADLANCCKMLLRTTSK